MNIYQKAIEHYGKQKQLNQAIEELNELAVCINHVRRKRHGKDQLIKEMADVLVMMEQLRLIHGIKVSDIQDTMEEILNQLDLKIEHEKTVKKYENELANDLYGNQKQEMIGLKGLLVGNDYE